VSTMSTMVGIFEVTALGASEGATLGNCVGDLASEGATLGNCVGDLLWDGAMDFVGL
jgi:hypothetical protein